MNIEHRKLIKDTVENLMIDLWRAKGFNDVHNRNAAEYNAFEADMKDRWETIDCALEELLNSYERTDYESQIEDLEENLKIAENDKTDLINRNYDLAEENDKLREILSAVSKVVNDTWC